MDEIDLLRSRRIDLDPPPEEEARILRHIMDLVEPREEVEESWEQAAGPAIGGIGTVTPPRHTRRIPGPVLALMAALVVVTVGMVVRILVPPPVGVLSPAPPQDAAGPASSDPTLSNPEVVPTTSGLAESPTVPEPLCGPELPFTAVLPDDFVGPTAGPSPDSDRPLEEGQLALHWTGRGGSVELRWPADANQTSTSLPTPADRDDRFSFIVVQPVMIDGEDKGLLPEAHATYPTHPTDEVEIVDDPCDVTQLAIYGPVTSASFAWPEAAENPTVKILPDMPRSGHDQLVVASLAVEQLPEVVACSGSDREDVPATRSSTVSDPEVYATPTEALEALLTTSDAESWAKTGYFELIEPDGSVTFGKPFEADPLSEPTPDDGLLIAVSVTPVEDGGWMVDSWTTSGC
jgi:hypothetical protein